MAIRFGPMGLTDILDSAFSIYRNRFPVFAGLALLTTLPTVALNAVFYSNYLTWAASLSSDSGGPASPINWLIPLLLAFPLHAILLPFYLSPLVLVASETMLGRPTGIGLALKATLRRYWGLWVLSFLLGLLFLMAEYSLVASLVMIAVAVILLVTAVTTAAAAATAGSAALAALISLGIALSGVGFSLLCLWPLVRLAASLPAVWAEGASITASLGRSWTLTRSATWRTLWILFLAFILAQVLALAAPPVAGLLQFAVPGFSPAVASAISSIAEGVLGQLGAPVLATAMCLVYYDLRVRKEAFDLELMSHHMRTGQPLEAAS